VSAGERTGAETVLRWAASHGVANRVEILGYTDGEASARWIADLGGKVMNVLAKGSLKHLTKQLRKTPDQHRQAIDDTVRKAERLGVACNLYLEDWSNGMIDSRDYVLELLDGLADTPILRIMLPDTLGVLSPSMVTEMVETILGRYPDRRFDFHAHNDYGLATANTLAAVAAGISGVHCTVNGMGERAGNAPLDEVVVGMHDFLGMTTRVQESKLVQVSERVDVVSGRRVPPNKAISGANAFTQTAGIHADGDRKGDLYQGRLLPERFGRERSYALGKLAGKATLEHHLDALGIELSGEQRGAVLERVKELADRKATITQQDLPYIVDDVLARPHERHFLLESVVVVSAIGLRSTATVKLRYTAPGGKETTIHEDSAQGDGGYDAFMNAVGLITGGIGFALPELIDYVVSIPPGGHSDAIVQCTITWRGDGDTLTTKGVNSDQVLAAADATEKMLNLWVARAVENEAS
jgi:D-citramalate synthase